MFLSNFSIKQPVTTVAIVIVLMCLGLLALKNLRVNQIPDVENPVMAINFPYPGASPETVEREIINRVEKPLHEHSAGLRDLVERLGEQRQLHDHLRLQEGHVGGGRRDPQRDRVACATSCRSRCASRCCSGAISAPEPIVNLGLSSTKQTHAEISRFAEDVLADQLRGIDGVAVVNVDGALRRELSVLLHAQKMREYNVSAGEVVNALRAQNTNAPVGRIKGDDGRAEHPARGPHRAPEPSSTTSS